MKKILFIIPILILLIGVVSAEQQSLGVFKAGQCIQLKQTCANCTAVNVTSVLAPNGVQMIGNGIMTKSGTEYNRTFCNTTQIGEYTYNTLGNPDGIFTVQPVSFTITPSGNSNMLGLFIIVIAIIYAIGFLGFFGKHVWVSMLGGMAMIALGIYTINNGIDMFRTQITEVFSWVTIGIGAIFALVAGIDLIQENL